MKYKKGDIVISTFAATKDEIGIIIRPYANEISETYVVKGFSKGALTHDGYIYASCFLKPIKNIDNYNKEELKKI